MFKHKHLPAVGAGTYNRDGIPVLDLGKRSQGILEELEKAHIYIAQLNSTLGQQNKLLLAVSALGHKGGWVWAIETTGRKTICTGEIETHIRTLFNGTDWNHKMETYSNGSFFEEYAIGWIWLANIKSGIVQQWKISMNPCISCYFSLTYISRRLVHLRTNEER